jgi:heme-degrading monooxygenase HmoA
MVVVTDFRSRLRTGVEIEVERLTQEMNDAVAAMDSFIDHKSYVASDDERVTIVRFRDLECQRRWSEHPSHREAQRRGREEFYSWYDIAVSVQRSGHEFVHPESS